MIGIKQMSRKAVYPVIFTMTDECVLIEVPDLGILTEGKNMADAIDMARDAIGLHGISLEDAHIPVPEASDMGKLDPNRGTFAGEGRSVVSMVDIDFEEYRRKVDNKTVRRNVTLPNWLNREAEATHINVSKVLQDALMKKLNVSR